MIRNPGGLLKRMLRWIVGREVVGLGSEKTWRTMACCHASRSGDRDDGSFMG